MLENIREDVKKSHTKVNILGQNKALYHQKKGRKGEEVRRDYNKKEREKKRKDFATKAVERNLHIHTHNRQQKLKN